VALNISGVDVGELERGNVVVKPAVVKPTLRIDAQVHIIPSAKAPLSHNERVKLYHGTAEVLARVRTLGKDAIRPGESGMVQLELASPLVGWKGDHFILRRPSPQETIGGGTVINPISHRRYKRYSEKTVLNLDAQRAGSVWDVFRLLIKEKPLISKPELEHALRKEGFDFQNEQSVLQAQADFVEFSTLCPQKELVRFFTTREALVKLSSVMDAELSVVCQGSCGLPGIPVSDFCKKLGVEECVLQALFDRQFLSENLGIKQGYLYRKDCVLQFSEKDRRKIERLDTMMERASFAPPPLETITEITGHELLQTLLFTEKLIRVEDTILIRDVEFQQMKDQLIQFLEKHGEITLAQFRDLLNTSRKYALAFLEYMDAAGVTVRVGESRKMKTSG
jgi:selenocysteine-specific elongation factor